MMKKPASENSRNRFFPWMLGLVLGAIAVRYAFQIDIPRIVFTTFLVGIALGCDRSELLALIVCCIPLHESVDLFFSLTGCVAVFLLKFYSRLRIRSGILVFLLMIIWELLHCFAPSFSPVQFLSSMIPLIVLALILSTDLSDLDYPLIVRTLAWATLSVAGTLLLKLLYESGFNFGAAVAGLQRLGVAAEDSESSVAGGMINPNSLGIICVLAATGLMQLRSGKAGTGGDLALACTVMVFGALTASRTYLVCLAAMFLLLAFANGETPLQKLRFLGLMVLLGVLAYLILWLVFPDLLAYYISRFFEADLTTGRSDLMVQYHRFLMDNPKIFSFGIGLQDFGTRLVQEYRVAYHVPHNSVQELVAAWGIPGVVLFCLMILTMYRSSGILYRRKILLNSIPLLIILLKGMAGQMLNSAYTMLTFSYAYLSLCANLTQRNENRISSRSRKIPRGSGLNIKEKRRKTNT